MKDIGRGVPQGLKFTICHVKLFWSLLTLSKMTINFVMQMENIYVYSSK